MLQSKYLTEEGLKMLLNDLYEGGTRYIYRPIGHSPIYISTLAPTFEDDGEIERVGSDAITLRMYTAHLLSDIFERTNCINLSVVLQKVDWSTVKVDTPVLVSAYADGQWTRRYFAAYKNGKVYAWIGGATSWSTDSKKNVSWWDYAKLSED